MGLIRAAVGAVGGTMADQWREFFYCEAMDADTLVVKGQKQVGSGPQTPRAVRISSQTVPVLQLQTVSV